MKKWLKNKLVEFIEDNFAEIVDFIIDTITEIF